MGKPVTRRSVFVVALAGVLVGALLVSVIPALADNGDPMTLGARNRAGRSTWLASAGASTLKLKNTAGGPALDLRTETGVAPLAVDSSTRVDDLNADMLDGKEAADFASALRGVPSGAVMFFDRITCPAGWSPYSTAEGRMIVGMHSGGTLEGLNGAALANLGDLATASGGHHGHNWANFYGVAKSWKTYGVSGGQKLLIDWNSTGGGTGASTYSLAPLAADASGTADQQYWTSFAQAHTHTVDLPYVQLLPCRKN